MAYPSPRIHRPAVWLVALLIVALGALGAQSFRQPADEATVLLSQAPQAPAQLVPWGPPVFPPGPPAYADESTL